MASSPGVERTTAKRKTQLGPIQLRVLVINSEDLSSPPLLCLACSVRLRNSCCPSYTRSGTADQPIASMPSPPPPAPSTTPKFFVLFPAQPPTQASTSAAASASTAASASSSASAAAPAFQLREHKKRKFHVKSRSGCIHCKRKRVKSKPVISKQCDETHPICKRCQRNNTPCVYDTEPNSIQRRRLQNEGFADPLAQPEYRSELSTQYASPPGATTIDMLLNHFTQNYLYITECSWMMPPWTAWLERPYLCTVTLAIAACHLRYHVARPKAHVLAECHLKDVSVHSFTRALSECQVTNDTDVTVTDTPGGAEALVGTALTIHMLAFALVDDVDPSACWAFSSDPDRLKWLEFQLGVKPFINGLNTSKLDARMAQMIDFVNDRGLNLTKDGGLGVTDIPDRWQWLMQLQQGDSFSPDVLAAPLRALAEMRETEADFMNIYIYMQFVGKLSLDFIQLLLNNDQRALWIFAYWLGMLGRYGYWWMRARIERDYYGILLFLQSTVRWHSADQADEEEDDEWESLMIELNNLDEEWGGVVRKQGQGRVTEVQE
ncbi:hypothetical protein B0T10DRAFT_462254 [Thelonectria olida]|uniref:Zn(2)-C6 fungal-type domain-containing protein n=1 Tax=Thelonectria olida TaxID=1576542 RepID=A0A9P9AMK2_9HYPO|nr:hypothetical protein B0T10DRAFT_462254 [Thelonectria olida]